MQGYLLLGLFRDIQGMDGAFSIDEDSLPRSKLAVSKENCCWDVMKANWTIVPPMPERKRHHCVFMQHGRCIQLPKKPRTKLS
ncbi:hypothetical protein OPV22_016577 [Ensete ventricosum]|uniref:Uncharacterized protein n=1 Tax=Ensete ventricosum TaxID=4639 RepID=A0AAV8QYZ3_ENSVE|nr:hypothetical protein OPV22_016577 [Ensete ventricosum]